MDKVLKKAAEILVECGDAKNISTHFYYMPKDDSVYVDLRKPDPFDDSAQQEVRPFADTLEGRRQADAIEDWLNQFETQLLDHSALVVEDESGSQHQWRLDRIKWCLEQLGEDNG